MKVELTKAQAQALLRAADNFLMSGTEEECRAIFGSTSGTAAAKRACERLEVAIGRRRL